MGLDCWVARAPGDPVGLTPEEVARFARLRLPLCEWTARGSSVHFSGKRYLAIVEEVAGACLSEPWLDPRALGEIAARFAATSPQLAVDAANASNPWYRDAPLTTDEFSALRVLFAECAAANLGLSSDW